MRRNVRARRERRKHGVGTIAADEGLIHLLQRLGGFGAKRDVGLVASAALPQRQDAPTLRAVKLVPFFRRAVEIDIRYETFVAYCERAIQFIANNICLGL